MQWIFRTMGEICGPVLGDEGHLEEQCWGIGWGMPGGKCFLVRRSPLIQIGIAVSLGTVCRYADCSSARLFHLSNMSELGAVTGIPINYNNYRSKGHSSVLCQLSIIGTSSLLKYRLCWICWNVFPLNLGWLFYFL